MAKSLQTSLVVGNQHLKIWQWEAATVPLIWQFLAARVGRKLLPDLNGGFPPSWTTKDYSVTMMGPLPS